VLRGIWATKTHPNEPPPPGGVLFLRDRLTRTTGVVTDADTGGTPGGLAISADGRYLAFTFNDPFEGVATYDRVTGLTTNIGDAEPAAAVSISGDGRFVAFPTDRGPPTMPGDLFEWDRTTAATTLVSMHLAGDQPNGDSGEPALSANGSRIAFASADSNLVRNDTNAASDVFVRGVGDP
jgi:Tol biopolymer transport system component